MIHHWQETVEQHLKKMHPQSTAFSFETKQNKKKQLEQLERLRSEDTPRRLMIIHTIESY